MAKAKKGKKAAPKLKRKRLKTSRPAPRKKPARKVAGKAPTVARKVSRKPAPKPSAKPATPPQPSPAPAALPGERIGLVTHYFSHLSVAVVKLDPGTTLRVGDNIHIKGHTSDFGQRVDSLQVGHAVVEQVGPDDDFGLKVVDHAREHDVVYRLK
jgi:putative protease